MKSLVSSFQTMFSRWVYGRIPPAKSVSFSNSNLFIFPSKAGFGYLLLVVLCWLVATNYENNVVFGLACLLTSLFIVAILHSFFNVTGLTVKYIRAEPAFAGESLLIELMVEQTQLRYRDNLKLSFINQEATAVSLGKQKSVRTFLTTSARYRGYFNPGRILIESSYPLGLLRVWSKVDLDIHCLVYPKPVNNDKEIISSSSRGEGPLQIDGGSEDFVGLKDYQPGDSLKRIAWKQYAREQGLYAKHYADYQDERIWLDWDSLPGLDREMRLSTLCGMLLKISVVNKGRQQQYGLRLPGLEIPPSSGDAHKYRVLKELALFETERGESQGLEIGGLDREEFESQGLESKGFENKETENKEPGGS